MNLIEELVEELKLADIDPDSVTDDEEKWLAEVLDFPKERIAAIALFFRRLGRLPETREIIKQDLYDVFLWMKLKELPDIKDMAKEELRDYLCDKAAEYPLISKMLNDGKVEIEDG